MYVAVDVGGTKTLVAVFDDSGKILEQNKFATSQDYEAFRQQLAATVANFTTKDFRICAIAIPGRIDRDSGRALGYGTLTWGEENVKKDVQELFNCPVLIENDAKLAGLYEARQLPDSHDVLYVTVGTGISCALVTNGDINPSLADSEGGQILVDLDGKTLQWEDAVSGRAIVERFGKRASEITDESTWKIIARDLAVGLIDLISVIQPDVIVMGGGVSSNFEKFSPYLEESLQQFQTPLVPIPTVKQATKPEEAVIYGCYELAKSSEQ